MSSLLLCGKIEGDFEVDVARKHIVWWGGVGRGGVGFRV